MQTVDENDIVREARRWLGTPFYHAGREIGVGVDCCGLVLATLTAVADVQYDRRDYSPIMPNGVMREELSRWCDLVEGDPEPGDVLLFTLAGMEQHVGFYCGGGTMIHAYQGVGVVSEHIFDARWRSRLAGVFRLKWGAEWPL